MKIKLDEGAILPRREHSTDAGADIFSREDVDIIPYGTGVFRTGVHIELPPNTVAFIMPKSGLNIWNDIMTLGVVDEGYTGEIVVKLFNHSEHTFRVQCGTKIAQLVVSPVSYEPLELANEINMNTERGSRGFGSTGLT